MGEEGGPNPPPNDSSSWLCFCFWKLVIETLNVIAQSNEFGKREIINIMKLKGMIYLFKNCINYPVIFTGKLNIIEWRESRYNGESQAIKIN